MAQFALAHAADDTGARLVEDCATQLSNVDDHTLGFVYVTNPLASELDEIVAALKAATPVQNWVGTVGFGICATAVEYFDRPAIVLLTGRFASEEFRLIPSLACPDAVPAGGDGFAAAMGIVHVDPRNQEASELVASFAGNSGVYLVGGLTSAESTFASDAWRRP